MYVQAHIVTASCSRRDNFSQGITHSAFEMRISYKWSEILEGTNKLLFLSVGHDGQASVSLQRLKSYLLMRRSPIRPHYSY